MEFNLLAVVIVSVIGLIAAILLAVASKFMSVPVDEKLEEVRAALPGVNCGACGYNGCDQYAEKLASGEESRTNLCVPGADAVSRKLSEILGVEFADVVEKYAVVRCQGDCDKTKYVMDYKGPASCKVCNSFYQGRGECSYTCLGFGDCTAVCKYDAIHIVNGLAVVDPEKCTGCGMCAKECPNHLITTIPTTSKVVVACSSHEKGGITHKVCSVGCIGCGKCARGCPVEAITMENNLAVIDPEKCVNCGKCAKECPTGAIRVIE